VLTELLSSKNPMADLAVKEIHVCVAMVSHEGEFLFQQRRHKNPMWDKRWEFPGGKAEQGETYEEAALRELEEETGIVTKKAIFKGDHVHDWHLDDIILRVHLHCFHCPVENKDVRLEDYSCYEQRWLPLSEAHTLDLLDGMVVIDKFFPDR